MADTLNARSMERLKGAHPDLAAVVNLAVRKSTIDIEVSEVLRSVERQRELVAKGASKTMDSRHITGHAVDLVPIIGGQMTWSHWEPFFIIAGFMRDAAKELDVRMEWGAVWDKDLASITGDMQTAMEDYGKRRRAQGKKAFFDGPHFQLNREKYPA